APSLVADRRADNDLDLDDDHPEDEVDLLAGALTGSGDRR
ncbi:MAG: hypothetical protein QOD57_4790, partial [Actinomycetota bacterium]|nr:hypothetical protein [Actinomycetota bacterium]